MRAIFERLMSFDTVSAHPNMDLMLWVKALLEEAGIAVTLIPDASGQKANVRRPMSGSRRYSRVQTPSARDEAIQAAIKRIPCSPSARPGR